MSDKEPDYDLDETETENDTESNSVLDIEPWPHPVDGEELLDEITGTFRRYLSLDPGCAEALTLWCVFTHAIEVSDYAPRLLLKSPVRQCGKTNALTLASLIARRSINTSSITKAAVYRVINQESPTLFCDEADKFLVKNRELVGVLNSGHFRPNAYVRIVVKTEAGPMAMPFRTFAPVAMAAIREVADDLESRSIIVPMRRRLPDEAYQPLRLDRGRDQPIKDLARMAARFVDDNLNVIGDTEPKMPGQLGDRQADNWRLLLAIADVAGGRWPKLARKAAVELSLLAAPIDETELLLGDMQRVVGTTTRVKTTELLAQLAAMEDRPWSSLDSIKLAQKLAPFKIKPKLIRFGRNESPQRGYEHDAAMQDAFRRYAIRG